MANEPIYQDAIETPLGLLPVEWQVERLGQVIEKPQYGLTASANQHPVGPKFLRITDIQEDRVHWADVPYCTCSEADKPKYALREGDLVIARIGATTGKAFLIREDNGCVFDSYVIRIRPKRRQVSPEFLNQYTKTGFYWCQIDATKGGRLKQGVNIPSLQNLLIPIPPLREQQAIAYVLRTIQRAKEATENTIAAARQLKSSLMRHLFTYGPVPVGQAEQVALKETDFGSVPQSWPITPLESCSQVQTGVAKGRSLNGAEVISVPYLRVANVQDGYLDLTEIKNIQIKRSELPRYSLQVGDVVLTEGGDFDKLGRGFIWNGEIPGCVHQNHVFAVRANRSMVLPEFLAYLTQSPYGKAYFLSVAHKTTNLACINTAKLKAFPALVPPLQEQRDIVDTLTAVDRKVAAEEKQRAALDSIFRTLLDHLMTGKIRVPDSGPSISAGATS